MKKEQKAHIVVGVGYGDEGKGMAVNHLCSISDHPIAIRFSGGQQAGHTVKYGSYVHTHSNFAAGTLAGYPSYWTEHTCMYPVTMLREQNKLFNISQEIDHTIHPLAKVTTPFDVFANREDVKNMEHGSCGLGIGMTMKRHKKGITFNVVDLLHKETIKHKLWAVANYYGYYVEEQLEVDLLEEYKLFLKACDEINYEVAGYNYLREFKTLVFEGSQGTLLDMDHGVFPHVTYANTTSKNALEICKILKIKYPTVYHMTRAYHTRHGNGPFKEETIDLINNQLENNVNNNMQGEFKVAPLDYELLNRGILLDICYSEHCTHVLFITCQDQIEEDVNISRIQGMHEEVWVSNSADGLMIQKRTIVKQNKF